MKSKYSKTVRFHKLGYIISTFCFDFLYEPLRNGFLWAVTLLMIFLSIKFIAALEDGSSPEVVTATEFHFLIAIFLAGYVKKLIVNFEK